MFLKNLKLNNQQIKGIDDSFFNFQQMKNIWVLFILIHISSFSQSKISSFKNLSTPEKFWVVFHPFKAKKAFDISNDAVKTTDSICKVNILDNDKNGGQADAFKHSFWIATLTQNINKRAAIKLGEAHEKGNYKTFKKGKLEDGYHPDKLSSEMDLYNNEIGANIGAENLDKEKSLLIVILIEEIKDGKMKILKKDELGNFLNCKGVVIPMDSLIGTWENEKCLIPSNSN